MKELTPTQLSRLHYFPLFIDDVCLLFSDYDAEDRTCSLHFDCDAPIKAPVTVFRAVADALNQIGRNGDIDILTATTDNTELKRFATLLGFKLVATVDKKDYLLRNFREV